MRIILVTTGQPSTNPRLVKEANALIEVGHQVKVYYLFWTKWASETDLSLLKEVKWEYELIGGSPSKENITFISNKIKSKFYKSIAKRFNLFLEHYRCKAYVQLIKVLKKDKADHYIAHNLGALAPAANAAKYHRVNYSFDAEDFHRGQYQSTCRDQEIDIILENKYFKEAKFITTASPLITTYYQNIYPKQQFITINNVFPPEEFKGELSINKNEPLKLVWFSQTIGKNRGLEQMIDSLNLISDLTIDLNLFGNHNEETIEYFNSLLTQKHHKIYFYKPLSPKELNFKLSEFDIGIASETTKELNRDICLTNKIFSYIQAGLAILASNTAAQNLLLKQNPRIGKLFNLNQIVEITTALRVYNDDRVLLIDSKKASLELANHLNWNMEKSTFINLFKC